MLIATGGGIKDSQREGFKFKKFIRSPITGAFAGFLLIRFSAVPIFLLLSTGGLERVIIEFYKTYYTKYTRGIFEEQKPKYKNWFKKRWIFFFTYLISVIIFIILFFIK